MSTRNILALWVAGLVATGSALAQDDEEINRLHLEQPAGQGVQVLRSATCFDDDSVPQIEWRYGADILIPKQQNKAALREGGKLKWSITDQDRQVNIDAIQTTIQSRLTFCGDFPNSQLKSFEWTIDHDDGRYRIQDSGTLDPKKTETFFMMRHGFEDTETASSFMFLVVAKPILVNVVDSKINRSFARHIKFPHLGFTINTRPMTSHLAWGFFRHLRRKFQFELDNNQ